MGLAQTLLACGLAGLFTAATHGQDASVQEHLQRAGQYLQAGNPGKAIPELQAVVAAQPGNSDAQANLGVLLYFRGDMRGAEPHLRAAVEAQPDAAKIRALLGLVEKSQGELDAAAADLQRALPQLDDPKFRKQVGLSLVEVDTQRRHLADAVAAVDLLQKSAPDDPEVLYAAYRVYTDLSADALVSLSLAAPKSGQMQQAIAHELLRVRDYPGAIASYRRALAANPDLPGLHTELAETLQASPNEADRAMAEQEFRLALKADPHDVLAMTHLADMRADAGDAAEARRLYQQALTTQPTNADALLGVAKLESDSGNDQAAADTLQAVLQADPYNVLAHFRLSAVYRKLHRPDDAKRELADYQRLKQMKEDLRTTYSTMKLRPPETGAEKAR